MNATERETLELAAVAESLLNLYMQAKRELHQAVGIVGVDVTKFPIVESVRAQIDATRKALEPVSVKHPTIPLGLSTEYFRDARQVVAIKHAHHGWLVEFRNLSGGYISTTEATLCLFHWQHVAEVHRKNIAQGVPDSDWLERTYLQRIADAESLIFRLNCAMALI